jgi:ABC-type lipoprotein export system ATPase subunit
VIELEHLRKTYQKRGEKPVHAIDDVSLTINSGEFVAILGPSGSGKSSLMSVIGLLDKPDSGIYTLDGRNVLTMGDKDLAPIRNKVIGFVFQAYHLLPRTTAIENVQLALLYANSADYKEKSKHALDAVGLGDRGSHYISELSGGQQQRVAIARAIVNDPDIILADEPTGNLDTKAQSEIVDLFKMLNKRGATVVIITHDQEVAEQANRIVSIRDGKIESDQYVNSDNSDNIVSA